MAVFDYKKEYKNLYGPKTKPSVIQVPEMKFIMVEGKGDPNTSPEYANALAVLYGLTYGIKMSKRWSELPEGYFDFVVPPLEGFWQIDESGFQGEHISDKDKFSWISVIRQPDFVTEDLYEKIKSELMKKKPELDYTTTSFMSMEEGLCVQIMHEGAFDEEPASIAAMNAFIEEQGLVTDIGEKRWHHEIYLNDKRKTKPENLKTVIRHPVK